MLITRGTNTISGPANGEGFSWYYQNGLSDQMAYITFFDKERPLPWICGGNGCHSCQKMKGPNNEAGPYAGHPDAHMQCRNIQIRVLPSHWSRSPQILFSDW